MRIQILLVSLLTLSVLCLCSSNASAQFGPTPFNSFSGPTVSPYLNLINPGGGFDASVARYQNYVRPQLDLQQRNRNTDAQLRGIQDQFRQLEQVRSNVMRPNGQQQSQFATGHPSVFHYHSHYYQMGRSQ